jgi:hypothetical protein
MSLDDVREIVMQHHSIELPGFSPYSAVQALIAAHQQRWPAAAERCLLKALAELQRMADRAVAATFARCAADELRLRLARLAPAC